MDDIWEEELEILSMEDQEKIQLLISEIQAKLSLLLSDVRTPMPFKKALIEMENKYVRDK